MSSSGVYDAVIGIPFGAVGVRCDASRLLSIEYLPPQRERPACNELAAEAETQLRRYLDEPGFHFDLPLADAGTPFQRRVWDAICSIPVGSSLSYGELAAGIGTAALAVGQACGANPFPLVIPCHRVVGKNGWIGGFANSRDGYLIQIKRWLLQHEARELRLI